MNRKIAIGCVVLIVIVIGAIGLGVYTARHAWERGKGWVAAQIADAKHRSEIESAWQPPSQRPDASWFPAAVDSWTLQTGGDITNVPDIQLERPGRRAKYRGDKQDVEVTVVPVAAEEREAVFDRAATALEDKGKHVVSGGTEHTSFHVETSGGKVTTRTPGRFYIKLNGDQHTRLWWMKDWLFIFQTTGAEDPDAFADKFIEAMKPAELEKR